MTSRTDRAERAVAAATLLESLGKAGVPDELIRSFRVAASPASYLELMIDLSETGLTTHPRNLRPTAKPQEVLSLLVNEVQGGTFSLGHASAVNIMLKVQEDWPWDELVVALKAALTTGATIQASAVSSALTVTRLLAVEGTQNAEELLQELVAGGHLFHHLYGARAEPDAQAEAACAITIAERAPKLNAVPNIGNAANGVTVYNEVIAGPTEPVVNAGSQLLIRTGGLSALVSGAEQEAGIRPLAQALVTNVSSVADSYKWVHPDLLINHFSLVRRAIGDEKLKAYLSNPSYKTRLIQSVPERGFLKGLVELYVLLLGDDDDTDPSFRDFLVEGLRNLPESSWRASLRNDDALIGLTRRLVEQVPLRLTGALADALLNNVKDVAQGRDDGVSLGTEAVALLDVLASDARRTLLRDIRDEVFREDRGNAAKILEMYGSQLIDDALLKEKADDMVRTFFRGAIARGDETEVAWVRNVLDSVPGAFREAPEESQSAFVEDLEAAIRDSPREELIPIGEALGMDVVELSRERSDDDEGNQANDEEA